VVLATLEPYVGAHLNIPFGKVTNWGSSQDGESKEIVIADFQLYAAISPVYVLSPSFSATVSLVFSCFK